MLLEQLREYSQRLDLPPVLYSEGPLRYVIQLDAEGRLLTPHLTDTADPSSPRTRRGQRRQLPQVQRAAGVKPLLLADKADYVLGYVEEGANAARAAECHTQFVAQAERCAAGTAEPSVAAVVRFLKRAPLSELKLDDSFDKGGVITFSVDGAYVIDLPSVQAFWAAENDPAASGANVMQCLVCGNDRPVLERLQAKLKGVPGGQTSGTAIISANAPAFESYGLEASLIAPTCADCGERFTKAANDLLSGESTRLVVGGSAYIFWTRESAEFSFRDWLVDPAPDQVKALLESPRVGRAASVDEAKFYATALSGSGGRAVVRDWIDTTIGEVKQSLRNWFAGQEIVGGYGEEPKPLGVFPLAMATVREVRDLSPQTSRWLMRTAMTGAPLPVALLNQAIRRNRAEQTVTRPRAALIKLVLSSQKQNMEDGDMVQLDSETQNAGYRCGRLLAVLEQAQRLAIPGVKATIVDRFFATASTSPAMVFPRLMRGVQPHLAKLERDRPGAYVALQRRLEEIQAGMPIQKPAGRESAFPRLLNLDDQGLFALGYYHQRAFDRAQAIAAAERRRKGEESTAEADMLDASDVESRKGAND